MFSEANDVKAPKTGIASRRFTSFPTREYTGIVSFTMSPEVVRIKLENDSSRDLEVTRLANPFSKKLERITSYNSRGTSPLGSMPSLPTAFAILPCSPNTAITLKKESEFPYRLSNCRMKGTKLEALSARLEVNSATPPLSLAKSLKSFKALVIKLLSITPKDPSSSDKRRIPSSLKLSVFAATTLKLSTKSMSRWKFALLARAIPLPRMFRHCDARFGIIVMRCA